MNTNEYLIALLERHCLQVRVGALTASPHVKYDEVTAKLLRLAVNESVCVCKPTLSYGPPDKKSEHCAACLLRWAESHANADKILDANNRTLEPCPLHKSQQ